MIHDFVVREYEENGELGLVDVKKPYFDPARGTGVAHDVLEEFPGGGEQPHDELQAFEAMIVTRALAGDMDHVLYTPGQQFGLEFDELFRHAFGREYDSGYGGYRLYPAPKTSPCKCEYVEDYISEAIEVASTALEEDPNQNEFEEWEVKEALAWLEDARSWIRIGYRRALKRFRHMDDTYSLSYMFKGIEKEVDKFMEHAQEGQALRVHLNISRSTYRIEPGYQDDHGQFVSEERYFRLSA
ncbi:MAG: hypothetical protein ACXABY_27740 [Candidatus Thorarchaeota archaeon]|jgi:hypothetical protein